jgi:hypothetical protein
MQIIAFFIACQNQIGLQTELPLISGGTSGQPKADPVD